MCVCGFVCKSHLDPPLELVVDGSRVLGSERPVVGVHGPQVVEGQPVLAAALVAVHVGVAGAQLQLQAGKGDILHGGPLELVVQPRARHPLDSVFLLAPRQRRHRALPLALLVLDELQHVLAVPDGLWVSRVVVKGAVDEEEAARDVHAVVLGYVVALANDHVPFLLF